MSLKKVKEGNGVPERGESCGVWFWEEVSPFGSMGSFAQKQRFLVLLCETFLREESESFSTKPIKGFEITSECEQQSLSDNISLSVSVTEFTNLDWQSDNLTIRSIYGAFRLWRRFYFIFFMVQIQNIYVHRHSILIPNFIKNLLFNLPLTF